MQQLVLFGWLAITSLLAAIGGWYADGMLGFLMGLPSVWLWTIGSIQKSQDYHGHRAPDWVYWIAGEPRSNGRLSWFFNPKIDRILSVVFFLTFAVIGMVVAEFLLSYLVTLSISCILGVIAIESYFKSYRK